MKTPPFIILADRGQLKAFKIERTPERGGSMRLISAIKIEEPRQRYAEKFTDQAGAFPNGGTNGQGNSIAERMPLEAEGEMRTFRTLAGGITDLLTEHRPERWAFAAPSEINGAILDGLAPELKASLTVNLPRDLVNTDAAELLGHFERAD